MRQVRATPRATRAPSRVEERALPRRPVFERESADVEPGDHAQRERGRREMQDARRARRVQRCGEARPIGGERRDAVADHVVIAAAAAAIAVRPARHAITAAQRPGRSGVAVADEETRGERRVDGEIPEQQREHRRREQVDALRAADADPGRRPPRMPRRRSSMPTHGRQRSARTARGSALLRSPRRSSASRARRAMNVAASRVRPRLRRRRDSPTRGRHRSTASARRRGFRQRVPR